MSDMSIQLTGGELTDSEMATLMEVGVACEEEAAPVARETEVMNPVTGAIVSLDDIDSLILGCDECKTLLDDLTAFYRTLREAAWAKTEGTAKTRRLRGKRHQAKVVQGDRYPVGAILKEAWNSYPQFREKYLKISRVDPQMREVAKLKSMTSDDPAFSQFKGMIERAIESGTEGLPTVSKEATEV